MVKCRFFDDETLDGEARDLDLDEPDFLLEIDDPSGLENSETAWIPLSAVKMVELPLEEGDLEPHGRKVAIRFLDGEVLRGHSAGEIKRHRYGLLLHLHPEVPGPAPRKLAVPFSAIKALFYIREFDGREEEQGLPSDAYLARRTMAPLLDVLEEMDALSRLHRGGLLTDVEFQSKRAQLLEVL
ncbi:MAG: hypothetical protein NVS9B1_06180 [Candidatus Dormibacteraceae bacterium]